MHKKTFKSIWAVVAGILTIVILSILTDAFLESIGFFPPATEGLFNTNLLLIALFYRTIYAFMGGVVTARLAPANPKKLVTMLLIFGTIMGLLGVVAGWNLSQKWYPISLVITSAVAVWFGGISGIKERSKKNS